MTDPGQDLDALARRLGETCLRHKCRVATAESCTGGGLAEAITRIPGSSQWFERGFVTYSNASKVELLGVDPETIRTEGAVSEATVKQMALGALARSQADIGIAITGVAGPDGGTPEKPVGFVWFALALRQGIESWPRRFEGDRDAVRRQSVAEALSAILRKLGWAPP